MRFVPIKTKDQQAALMLHRARQLLVRQRTMLSNAIRGHLAELGIVSAKGRNGTGALLEIIADAEASRVPPVARGILDVLARQYSALGAEIGSIDRKYRGLARSAGSFWMAGDITPDCPNPTVLMWGLSFDLILRSDPC
jgi:transposase